MRRRYLGRGSAVLAALALTGTVVAAAPAAPSGGGGAHWCQRTPPPWFTAPPRSGR